MVFPFLKETNKSETNASKQAYHRITPQVAKEMMDNASVTIVDVRNMEEYRSGAIGGAICIPNLTIGNVPPVQLPDLNATILIYCRSGVRSRDAAYKLVDMGYTKVYDFGGILSWPYEIATP